MPLVARWFPTTQELPAERAGGPFGEGFTIERVMTRSPIVSTAPTPAASLPLPALCYHYRSGSSKAPVGPMTYVGVMIEQRPFGRTGHQSSRIIFGAAAMGGGPPRLFEQIFQTLREFGVNHIDTAAKYGDSELNLAPFLDGTRHDWFLASKTGDRSGAEARASLEHSLERMGVDHLDLIQLHNLVEEDEWHQAFSPDGAVAALFQARDEGLVRHVGVTGHGLRIARMHIRSLAEADFASVLLPYNHSVMADPRYRDDVEELLGICVEREVAVQTIKSIARRRWAPDHDGARFSWYQPLDEGDALTRAVHYVLADDRVFLNTSSDARLLRATCQAAMSVHGRPSDDAITADQLANGVQSLFDWNELERI